MSTTSEPHHIVIVGGGAGGLELATKLGHRLGKRGKASITLIDATLTHIWKPLLHEVAAGTLNSYEDQVEYLAQGHWHHFRFRLGRMDGLDRAKRIVSLAPTHDENGNEFVPRREFSYDTLIIAVGSVANDFDIPGVKEHCRFLDTREQADMFHSQMLRRFYRAQTQDEPLRDGQLNIAIAGAGATGVELAAELHETSRQLVAYGLDRIKPDKDMRLTIVEAAERILPALPPRLSNATQKTLNRIGVEVYAGERIVEATAEGFRTHTGRFIAAETKVWAAGIKAPDFLREIDGLETNRGNQLQVHQTLQTTRDENIFAFGDCAACPQPGTDANVPPRAQAAHQQASLLVKNMERRLAGKTLLNYVYKDYGSLINLSRYSTVGSLMGNLTGKFRGGNVMIEGLMARFVYNMLYKMHQVAVHGFARVTLLSLADILTHKTKPRMKLH